MTTKMKIWSLIAIGVAITIFWAILSMIFESVVFRIRSGWEFLPWYFCDVVATIGGIATFVFVYWKPEEQSTTCLHVGECKGEVFISFFKLFLPSFRSSEA